MDKPNPDPKANPKQPFVSKEDRPGVKISLDTPLTELRVRELGAILGFLADKSEIFDGDKTSLKDFFDKDFPEVAKDWIKDIKSDKLEKLEKFEKNEKLEKREKFEKPEIKELKNEKWEREPVFEPGIPGPDPMMQQVIQALAGLTKQVSQLANQVEELKKRVKD
jgi:hypothetical protein